MSLYKLAVEESKKVRPVARATSRPEKLHLILKEGVNINDMYVIDIVLTIYDHLYLADMEYTLTKWYF